MSTQKTLVVGATKLHVCFKMFCYIYLCVCAFMHVYMYGDVCMYVCMCHGEHVEARGQLMQVGAVWLGSGVGPQILTFGGYALSHLTNPMGFFFLK